MGSADRANKGSARNRALLPALLYPYRSVSGRNSMVVLVAKDRYSSTVKLINGIDGNDIASACVHPV